MTRVQVFSIAIFISLGNCCLGQTIIGSRFELALSTGPAISLGPGEQEDQPTLLANMKKGRSLTGSLTARVFGNFHFGCWINRASFAEWQLDEDKIFTGSRISMLSYGPSMMYNFWSAKNKQSNRFYVRISVSPGLSSIAVTTTARSSINDGSKLDPLKVHSTRFTIGGEVGCNYILSNTFGILATVGYQNTITKSQIFSDKNYSFVKFQAGVVARLYKDKKYKYSAL